jgi:hypothetical protein
MMVVLPHVKVSNSKEQLIGEMMDDRPALPAAPAPTDADMPIVGEMIGFKREPIGTPINRDIVCNRSQEAQVASSWYTLLFFLSI